MIDLSSRRLDDETLLDRVKNLEHIVSLNLQNNKVTVQGINRLLLNCAFRHDLESLNISNNQITYEIFNLLISFPCPSLKYLDLSQNSYPHNIMRTTLYKRFKALYGQLQIKINGQYIEEVNDLVYNPINVIINIDQMCRFCREMFMDKLTYIDQVTGQQQFIQNTNQNQNLRQSTLASKNQNIMKKSIVPFVLDHDAFNLDTNNLEFKFDEIDNNKLKPQQPILAKSNQPWAQYNKDIDQLQISDLTHVSPSGNIEQDKKLLEQLRQKKQLMLTKLKQKEQELQHVASKAKKSQAEQKIDVFSMKRQEINSKLAESFKKLQSQPYVSTKVQLNLQKIKISDLEFQINTKLNPQDNQKSVSNLASHYVSIEALKTNTIENLLQSFGRILSNHRDTEVNLYHLVKEKDELVQQDQQSQVQQQQRVCNALNASKAVFDQSAIQFYNDSARFIEGQIEKSQVVKSQKGNNALDSVITPETAQKSPIEKQQEQQRNTLSQQCAVDVEGCTEPKNRVPEPDIRLPAQDNQQGGDIIIITNSETQSEASESKNQDFAEQHRNTTETTQQGSVQVKNDTENEFRELLEQPEYRSATKRLVKLQAQKAQELFMSKSKPDKNDLIQQHTFTNATTTEEIEESCEVEEQVIKSESSQQSQSDESATNKASEALEDLQQDQLDNEEEKDRQQKEPQQEEQKCITESENKTNKLDNSSRETQTNVETETLMPKSEGNISFEENKSCNSVSGAEKTEKPRKEEIDKNKPAEIITKSQYGVYDVAQLNITNPNAWSQLSFSRSKFNKLYPQNQEHRRMKCTQITAIIKEYQIMH